MDTTAVSHLKIHVTGIVQGVGFRPFVFRLATEKGLNGTVLNNARGVTLHLQGDSSCIRQCLYELQQCPPPLARIDSIMTESLPLDPALSGFRIIQSVATNRPAYPSHPIWQPARTALQM